MLICTWFWHQFIFTYVEAMFSTNHFWFMIYCCVYFFIVIIRNVLFLFWDISEKIYHIYFLLICSCCILYISSVSYAIIKYMNSLKCHNNMMTNPLSEPLIQVHHKLGCVLAHGSTPCLWARISLWSTSYAKAWVWIPILYNSLRLSDAYMHQ